MSVRAAALALATRLGRMRLPRFKRIDVGNSSRISLEKAARRVEGLREVVTSGRGSERPESMEYSSSIESWAAAESGSRDSSYLKSLRRDLSLATEGSRGLPEARDFLSRARFSAMLASRSWRARR